MLKIDNTLLVEIGLGSLPDSEKNSFLKHVYETLEMRVGIRLADQMTNEQLDEFERYFEAKDDAGAFKWLETNFPNYKEIVQEEFDKLKAEVAQTAPQILAASQAQAAAPPAPIAEQSAPSQAPAPQQPDAQQYQAPPQPVQQPQYQPAPEQEAAAPQTYASPPAPAQYQQPPQPQQYVQPPAPQPYPQQQPPAGPAQ
ncbi:MAG: DUF5663 domain-containing protein [Patescibacteria group bacterium]|nr:DUF5663 domain-containing protein [Patescibacteria group bacterium]